LLKNGTENVVVQILLLQTFDDSFEVQGEFELSLDDLHQVGLANKSWLIRTASKSNKGVNWI